MTKVRHQVSQSNWLDGKSLGKGLFETLDKRSAKDNPIHRQSMKVMTRKDDIVITWPSERRVPEGEVTWQQSSRTSPWSVWLPPQRPIESGFYLEPRVPFLTYALDFSTYALDFSSSYALEHLCTKLEGYSAWVSADRLLVEAWGWIILWGHLVARSDRSAGRSQTSSLV